MEEIMKEVREALKMKTVSDEKNDEFMRLCYDHRLNFFKFTYKASEKNLNFCLSGELKEHELNIANCVNHAFQRISTRLKSDIVFFFNANDGTIFPDPIQKLIDHHILLINSCALLLDNNPRILVVDPYMLSDNKIIYNECVYLKGLQTPFNKRINKADFCGSQTGGDYNMNSVHELKIPRLKAIHLKLHYPDLLDIKFNNYSCQSDNSPEYLEYMNKTFGPACPFESIIMSLKNKYLLSFDGNFVAFSRPELIMASGSVPLIQTRYRKYWSRFLVDGENYIHIKDDLSNLISTIEYLNANPDIAERIATNARETYEKYIAFEFADELFIHVLNAMSEI